jgi:hypothetical protein
MTRVLRRPVKLRSMLQRLQRSLKAEGQHLYAPRGRGRTPRTWYIVDSDRDRLVADNLEATDLERIARERGVLRVWEVMA